MRKATELGVVLRDLLSILGPLLPLLSTDHRLQYLGRCTIMEDVLRLRASVRHAHAQQGPLCRSQVLRGPDRTSWIDAHFPLYT